jgi:hypothetical protein
MHGIAYSTLTAPILNQVKAQAVILDFINKQVSYVSVAKVAKSMKPRAGTTFSGQASVPPPRK